MRQNELKSEKEQLNSEKKRKEGNMKIRTWCREEGGRGRERELVMDTRSC